MGRNARAAVAQSTARSTVQGEVVEAREMKYRKPARKGGFYIMESLILAQNERWRRVLSMQVERQAL